MKPVQGSPVRAFTLIELLIAVTLTLALAAAMLKVTIDVLGLWQRSQSQHTQLTAAKQVLDTLERDLQAPVWRRDATKSFAVEILDTPGSLANHGWLFSSGPMKPANGGSLLPLPPDDPSAGIPVLEDARFGLSGTWLRFIASNVESGGSLPVLVAYQIARRPVTGDTTAANPAPSRYSLYRTALSTAETFSQGYDVTSGNYSSGSNTPSSITTTTNRSRANVINPSHANLIASNVVDFGCWLYRRNADGTLARIFPAASGDVSHIAQGNSVTDGSRYPDVVDVFLRVVSDQGATLIESIEGGRVVRPAQFASDTEWWWSVVEANSVIVTRRIELKGGAL